MFKKYFAFAVFSFLFVVFLFLLCINLGIINIYKNIQLQLIGDMDNQKKISVDYFFLLKNIDLNALPLKESIATLDIFYEFEPQQYEKPEKELRNPLKMNEFILERGKTLYSRFCVSCHNSDGKGSGPIVTQVQLAEDEEGFPPPKDLTSESTRKMNDGRLFHILSAGQNLMFPFHDKLTEFDKWSLIHYIRNLQNEK